MQQKNVQSTKLYAGVPLYDLINLIPSPEPRKPLTNTMYDGLMKTTELRKSYSEYTGKFPFHLPSGHSYIFILYEYYPNASLSNPLKNRQNKSIVDAW